MASSDKILKWNVCGVQGAALFRLMEPIYFSSISVEKHYDKKNLTRALYERAKLTTELPYPFTLKKPMIVYTFSKEEFCFPNETENYSVNWNAVEDTFEFIDFSTGLTSDGQPSRLSKNNFCSNFKRITSTCFPQFSDFSYEKIKFEALYYQESSKILKRRLKELGLGDWIRKGTSSGLAKARSAVQDFTVDEF